MASLSDIRAGLAAAITAAIPDAQCSGYVLANPTPPFFDIELSAEGVDYDQAMARGVDLWRMTVRGCVAVTDSLASQKTLDLWCAASGDRSVKAALEADLTLGGVASALRVTQLAGYRAIAVRGQPNNVYLGAEWTVEVYAQGS